MARGLTFFFILCFVSCSSTDLRADDKDLDNVEITDEELNQVTAPITDLAKPKTTVEQVRKPLPQRKLPYCHKTVVADIGVPLCIPKYKSACFCLANPRPK